MAAAQGTPVTGVTGTQQATAVDFTFPQGAPVLGALQNPNRLYLLVLFSNSTGRVCPAPGSLTLGFGPDVGGQAGARLIHRASFPGLIDGEWYVYDSAPGTIRVYDVEHDPPPR